MVSSRLRLSLLAILALVLLVFPRERLAEAETVVPDGIEQLQYSFAPLVKRVSPAVVNVYVTHRVKEFVSPFDESYLREFFGDDYAGPRERLQNSLGSGVIVSADGLVVTNNHVVAGRGEAEIRIALTDKREFDAKLIKTDKKADLAVLRIEAPDVTFPFLELEDSDGLEVGDLVLAIGNPFGVGQTVTSGIVSALARTRAGISDHQFFIQTDAAINPGNSGGALVTIDGKLIGINTAIYSRSGGNIGIGFAIPANMVKLVVDTALVGGKKLAQPWLGFSAQPVTAEIATTLGLDRPTGLIVKDVSPGSPAAQAGLKTGDVVTKIDDFEVNDPQGVHFRAATKGIGNTVSVAYLRDGARGTTSLRLVRAPENPPRSITEIRGDSPLSGVTVANLSPAYAEELQIEITSGVIITEVRQGTPAARLGVRAGDIIVSVGGVAMTSISELDKAMKRNQRRWALEVRRGNQLYQMTVPG